MYCEVRFSLDKKRAWLEQSILLKVKRRSLVSELKICKSQNARYAKIFNQKEIEDNEKILLRTRKYFGLESGFCCILQNT